MKDVSDKSCRENQNTLFVVNNFLSENNNNNNNNNLLTAIGLSPGGSGYFTFKLRQTY
jgi:hypothetical protein